MAAEIKRLVNAAGAKPRGSFQAKGMMPSMMLRQTHRPQGQRIGLAAPAISERKPISRRQSYGNPLNSLPLDADANSQAARRMETAIARTGTARPLMISFRHSRSQGARIAVPYARLSCWENPEHEKDTSMAMLVPGRPGFGADGPYGLPNQRGRHDAAFRPLSGASAAIHSSVAGVPLIEGIGFPRSRRSRRTQRRRRGPAFAQADPVILRGT